MKLKILYFIVEQLKIVNIIKIYTVMVHHLMIEIQINVNILQNKMINMFVETVKIQTLFIIMNV